MRQAGLQCICDGFGVRGAERIENGPVCEEARVEEVWRLPTMGLSAAGWCEDRQTYRPDLSVKDPNLSAPTAIDCSMRSLWCFSNVAILILLICLTAGKWWAEGE